MVKVPDNVVFYDGVCNLCASSVKFLVKRDKKLSYFYAQIGGNTYHNLISIDPKIKSVDSILLFKNEKIFIKSSAAIEILVGLGGFWRLFNIFWIVPKPIRDLMYDQLAYRRYRVFGKKDFCLVPNHSLNSRFLD